MDVKEIERLAWLMQETGLTGLEFATEGTTLKLERKQETTVVAAPAPVAAPAGSPFVPAPAQLDTPAEKEEGTWVLSPTVGVFYAAPSPDAKPYVQVGDQVKKGDVLCIIEAMKLMNEIPAEVEGTVAEIAVGNGQVVEYNQPLFRIV